MAKPIQTYYWDDEEVAQAQAEVLLQDEVVEVLKEIMTACKPYTTDLTRKINEIIKETQIYIR